MEKQKRTVAFLTLGCKVNTYETNAMEKLFLDAGYEITEFTKKADVYIINTCTVTNMADRKSRQMLHKAKKNNPEGIVVAAGCYAQAAGEELTKDMAVDLVVGNNRKSEIVTIVENYMGEMECSYYVTDKLFAEKNYEELTIDSAGDKTRAVIKIQDGCNQFCSYCIIPFARGRVRSREIDDIVSEVERLVAGGYKEVVLTGIHLSSYGVDLDPWREGLEHSDFVALSGRPLLAVIERISKISGLERIRLGSLEPRIISEAFAGELAGLDKVCPHFHLSLQSGCNETLKRMNRHYSAEEYYEKCEILRRYFDNPAITTDVIVGFPGETEEEFEQTKEFLSKIKFAQMHIFKFSPRKGTKAECMENQVEENKKTLRSEQLIELEKHMRQQYMQQFTGTFQNILFEEEIQIGQQIYQTGHNERYVKIAVLSDVDCQNYIHQVKITGFLNNDILLGEK
ncbi:tRNA (N(6)-L-threonylcarbamoyladenosine(37)-C(2))-methylthiotransferase MtaB [Anaeromicropila populeti]|uniref:tRNA (N(6)-L-threonylcarbamoyladenosine(37)-C(2))- methylthiotransferase MtaB n=1 Tax=Anaeromicropila populeti TaxID=37658 RepID=UPI002342FBDC|nr:tRNA (N(6)-L-threonylcarbamoyladenosine(37)-C(2))-methylthiotransferase MtaB [Anaeromicropila populeti]